MPAKTVLITRTRHDDLNNYLYYWSNKVIEFAENHGHEVIDLEQKKKLTEQHLKVLFQRKSQN